MFHTRTYHSVLQMRQAFETAQKCTVDIHLGKVQLVARVDHLVCQLHRQTGHEYFDRSSHGFEL